MSVSFSLISCSWLDRRSHRFSTIGEVTEVGEVSCCEEEVECHDGTESNNNNNNNGEKVSQCCRVWEKRDNIHPADGWCRKRHGRKKETKRKKKNGWVEGIPGHLACRRRHFKCPFERHKICGCAQWTLTCSFFSPSSLELVITCRTELPTTPNNCCQPISQKRVCRKV